MKLDQNGSNQRFWNPSNQAISYLKKKYKRFNTLNDWTAVKPAKNTFKGSIRSAKNNFFHKSSINLKKSRKSKMIIYIGHPEKSYRKGKQFCRNSLS